MILRIDKLAIELPMPAHPSPQRVVDGPPGGGRIPLHPEEPQLTSPIGPDGIDPGMLKDIGEPLFGKASVKK